MNKQLAEKILKKIREYSYNEEPLNYSTLSRELDINPGTIKQYVYYWIGKGKAKEIYYGTSVIIKAVIKEVE